MPHQESFWITSGIRDEEKCTSTVDLISLVLSKFAAAIEKGEKQIAERKGTLTKCYVSLADGDIDIWFYMDREYTEEEIMKQAQDVRRAEQEALFKIRDLIDKYPHLKDKI